MLGFEYGYSLDCPDGLVLWEAQFGDFVNAAQVIIDQFIASAEDKWRRLSGLVLLLPHGFEGRGPSIPAPGSSAFSTLAGEDNIQVVNPTTPAQYFHVLRRQVLRPWRKPLVVMTPKSLLRHPRVVSPLDDLRRGPFQRVIPDDRDSDVGEARAASAAARSTTTLPKRARKPQRDDVAIVRIEQLYPLPTNRCWQALTPYADGTPVVLGAGRAGEHGRLAPMCDAASATTCWAVFRCR